MPGPTTTPRSHIVDGAGTTHAHVPVVDAAGLALAPAARLLWRSPDTVQFELAGQATVVRGLPEAVVRAVAAPSTAPAVEPADRPPWPPGTAAALHRLTSDGYLWPRTTDAADGRLHPPDPRLAGELTALTARHGAHAAHLLAARAQHRVDVHGRSRVAPHLAALLAASGAAGVRCVADGVAKLSHATPGGLLAADEGGRWVEATSRAVRRAAPEADAPRPGAEGPAFADVPPAADLVVLADDRPPDDERVQALQAAGTAHLVVSLGPDRGTVGPLVLPGLTGCLHCADLHRRDRDPAWPALAVQLTVPRRYGTASGVALAAVVAGIAALQVLAYLDGEASDIVDATLELAPPDWRVRRRSWPPHAGCGCVDGDAPTISGTMEL